MHTIIMWLGGIVAAMGVVFFVLIIVVGGRQNAPALLTAVGIGGGMIVSGALLYCFGAIVDHLIAIRKNTERQVEIFDRLRKAEGVGIMTTYWNQIDKPLEVADDVTVHGLVANRVDVRRGGLLRLHGMITGDLIVDAGATAYIDGMVGGCVANYGEVHLYGTITRLVEGPGAKTTISPRAVIKER